MSRPDPRDRATAALAAGWDRAVHQLLRLARRLPPNRASMRLRLALILWVCFVLAGTALLAANYALVRNRLENPVGNLAVLRNNQGTQIAPGPGLEYRSPLPEGQAPPPGSLTNDEAERLRDILREQRLTTIEEALNQLLTQSGLALLVVSVAVAGLAWVVAGRALRPVAAITAAANRLSGSNLHERINLAGPDDELKELADTFDRMLGRLDASFASQRRFVANASHELRTPLTIMRTEIDVALADPDASTDQLRAMAERSRAALERSEALIASLLLLARSERRPEATCPLDLASAAEDALDAVGAELRSRGLRLDSELRPAVVSGDRALLERAVANLVENAVRHNRQGGRIRVVTGTRAGRAGVWVASGGPVVPPALVGELFEPFRRAAGRTGADRGTGLGLSIVRAVADAHGGRIAARAPATGGLEVRLELPAWPPAPPAVEATPRRAPGRDAPVPAWRTRPGGEQATRPGASANASAGPGRSARLWR